MARRARWGPMLLAVGLTLSACSAIDVSPEPSVEVERDQSAPARTARITLAVAGDVHFEAQVADLLRRPRGALGPIARTLRRADVAMLNLESPVTDGDRRDPKELERPDNRFHFRTSPRALDVLDRAGVDVLSLANNHAGDYGREGLRDTLAAARDSGVAVVGIGRDRDEAFAPHRVSVDGVDVALLAADTVFREGRSDVWAAGTRHAGVAAARSGRPRALLDAVRAAAEVDDVVVVYLHWGRESQACPSQRQRLLARNLGDAGASVVVGSHTHRLGGAGWSDDTYVAYGLGNFVWYHDRQPDTGVLTLRLDADGVDSDTWTPARIGLQGRPRPLSGSARREAVGDWQRLQRCTGLGTERGASQADDPAYDATVQRIGADLARRMRTSHRAGCPVPLRDLRYLRMTHRDFSGRARTGEMVVHKRWARPVTEAFGELYAAGWPIARMRLVDDYGGDDDASMAANNTSGFNCRRVAGQQNWSAHAYGAAIDLNPVQNPYVRAEAIDPPAGRRFAGIDRARTAPAPLGSIRSDGLAVRAFAAIGWQWGGDWISSKDYQHVAAPDAALDSLASPGR